MNLIVTKELETERLILKVPSMKEQKRLWEILTKEEVYSYYLAINKKYAANFFDWDKQEKFYQSKIENMKDGNKFIWSIFLKENGECIGQIDSHDIDGMPIDIKDVGWYIDPLYQGKGYATEAARAMFDYMFNEVKIEGIKTGAALINPASTRVMDHLGMTRVEDGHTSIYTFIDEPVVGVTYMISRDEYLNSLKAKRR